MTHKPKIYRTVPVNDEGEVKGRLPDKSEVYFVIDPNQFGQDKTLARFTYTTKRWFNDGDEIHTSHWLEEVELPSEEELEQMMLCQKGLRNKFQCFVGARWLLNLILNKK